MSLSVSNSDLAVSVRGLSKSYTIAHEDQKHTLATEALLHSIKNLGKKPTTETFWALKDVSFDIKKGDVVGIVGRNGAGKSTLLKILSRITEPTSGQIDLFGRVGSLLEVGTGFHAELTGRENIYLNGAILGMSKHEIAKHFDAIIDFSGVEQFLDTPVKRYSSGMYVRLAFAVAAHLEPEILIVDEVLAVGDAEFQKKCLGKIQDVAAHGRTVIFVSHNMAAVQGLCKHALMFEHGQLSKAGDVDTIVRYYLEHTLPSIVGETPLAQRTDRSGDGSIRLTSFHVEDEHGSRLPTVVSGMTITLVFGYQCLGQAKPSGIDIGCSVSTTSQETLFVLYSSYLGQTFTSPASHGEFRCTIPHLPLSAGRYSVGARVVVGGEEADWPRDGVGYLEVEAGDFYQSGQVGVGSGVPFLIGGSWGRGGEQIVDKTRNMINVHRLKNGLKRVLGGASANTPAPRHFRESYGQVGEDIIINFLVGGKPNGFYVDVGAHHPQRYSNTYFFYQRGWRGINIDALPGSMEAFKTLRPNDINLEMGISGTQGTLTYYAFDEPAVNGFSKEVSEARDEQFHLLSETPIQTYPLVDVLDKYLPAGQAIDFLSVDVEGLDSEVLQSNDWTKYRPNVVLAEDLAVGSLEELHASELTKLMRGYGYVACSQCIHTLFYLEEGLFDKVMR